MTTKEVLTRVQKTVEVAIPFAATIGGIWGLDMAAYATAIGTAIIYVLEAVKYFVK